MERPVNAFIFIQFEYVRAHFALALNGFFYIIYM